MKKPERQKAYMMTQGETSLQYRVFEVVMEEGAVVYQKEIGVGDLKPVVLGRLLKLLVKL